MIEFNERALQREAARGLAKVMALVDRDLAGVRGSGDVTACEEVLRRSMRKHGIEPGDAAEVRKLAEQVADGAHLR